MDTPLSEWVGAEEKFAAMFLDVPLDPEAQIPLSPISAIHWVIADAGFAVPEHWKEWIGSVAAESIELANLTLLSKVPSRNPNVVDEDSKAVEANATDFYTGLLLTSPFGCSDDPVLLSGSREGETLGVRSHSRFPRPMQHPFRYAVRVDLKVVQNASRFALALSRLRSDTSSTWRFLRVLQLYIDARSETDQLERLHQFCRCIEGFILPDPGDTKRQFKSRTELFIGPRHHDLMGRIYDARSAAEHLNEHILLEPFDRSTRLEIIKQLAIAEHIARYCITKTLDDPTLFQHFRTVEAQKAFWALPATERKGIWGAPIDPSKALEGFNPNHISDRDLGRYE